MQQVKVGDIELMKVSWGGTYCPGCGADLQGRPVDAECVVVDCPTCQDGWHAEELLDERTDGQQAVWDKVGALSAQLSESRRQVEHLVEALRVTQARIERARINHKE